MSDDQSHNNIMATELEDLKAEFDRARSVINSFIQTANADNTDAAWEKITNLVKQPESNTEKEEEEEKEKTNRIKS